jgi:hypothetical protein
VPLTGVPGLQPAVTQEAELLDALLRSVDRVAMLRAHTAAALSTARVRQAGSQDPDQFTEVIELLTMALEEDDRWLHR